jgi:hypothetical protein
MRERRRFEEEIGALSAPVGQRELQVEDVDGKSHKCIVLVAGCEYPRYQEKLGSGKKWYPKRVVPQRPGGISHWRTKCLDLAEYKLKKDPGTTVVLFDLDRGTKETVQRSGGKLVVAAMSGFTPLPMVDSDYRIMNTKTRELSPIPKGGIPAKDPFVHGVHVAYCPHISQVSPKTVKLADWAAWLKQNKKLGHPELGLGIEHVYDHVEAIGKARPGNLAELHLFGHASSSHDDANGTAFVNTWEFRDKWNSGLVMPANKRSPLDLDARANVDFVGRSASFAKAFGSEAFSQVWGCNWHRPDHAVLHAVRGALKGKALKDNQTFDIPIGNTHLGPAEFEEMFTKPFAHSSSKPVTAAPGAINAKKNVWKGLTGKWVRDYFAALLDRTYMKALARASGHHVLGGLPVTYSSYDNKRHPPEPLLCHIPMGTKWYRSDASDNFLEVMAFFAQTYGSTFGPGAHPKYGRGFAWYDP